MQPEDRQPKKNPERRSKTASLIIIVVVLALLAELAIVATSPSGKSAVPIPTNGIGFESLCSGENGRMDGGLRALLLSSAVTRGATDEQANYPQSLASLTFYGTREDGALTLLRDPESGALASKDSSGTVRKLFSKYVAYLLSTDELNSTFPISAPQPISVNGQEIPVYSYDADMKNLSGKTVRVSGGEKGEYTVICKNDAAPEVGLSSGLASVTSPDGSTAFSGDVSSLSSFKASGNGLYIFEVSPLDGILYRFAADYEFKPEIHISATTISQGDSFLLTVLNAPDDVSATVTLDYTVNFTRTGDTAWAYVPVGYRQTTGDYQATVSAGTISETFDFSVTPITYPQESFEMYASTASGSTSSDAYAVYKEEFLPLYYSYEPEVYWHDTFIPPVKEDAEGYWVSSEFGVVRTITYLTSDDEVSSVSKSYHAGIDFACAEGTPIYAPNAGKVIYSGYLEYMVGNAIIIDHGNGLHSMFYHMNSRNVEKGDIVEKGDVVGTVGTTGYSTGPHLHYSLMIGDYNINPNNAFDGTAGFYAAPSAQNETSENDDKTVDVE